jgi:hypothetical protein
MTEACPYCRTKVSAGDPLVACEGCGTVHHADCYAENGGCTIFGCSKAPADEPKLHISTPELVGVAAQVPEIVTRPRALPPPPPSSGGVVAAEATQTSEDLQRMASNVVPSIFGGFGSVPAAEPEPLPSKPKSRTTFIVLGALLGALGAHNFYAGYHKKGGIQLALTALTLGFAGPMSWVWAVIDICTVNQDSMGVQFET